MPAFNDKFLRGLKPRKSAFRVFANSADPDDKGLGCLVTPAGTRSLFLSYTSPVDGRRKEVRLGIFPGEVSLADARRAAREARYQIRDGRDPVAETREARAEVQAERVAEAKAARAPTVADLLDFYVKKLEHEGRRSAAQARRLFDVEVKPQIGAVKASAVTSDQLTDVISGIGERGKLVMANRARSWVRAAFAFALIARSDPVWRKKCPEFNLAANPAASVGRPLKREKAGDRFLSVDELRAVWHALDTPYAIGVRGGGKIDVMPDQLHAFALKILLTTGQRVEEVLEAEWSEFDLEAGTWTIRADRRKNRDKATDAHLVPLCTLHVELLKGLRACGHSGRELLFPDPNGTPRKAGSLGHFVVRLCDRIELLRFAPRDCRRTWKTLAGAAGVDLELRNRIQGHGLQDVGSRHYDRHEYADEKRAAMAKWCAWLQARL